MITVRGRDLVDWRRAGQAAEVAGRWREAADCWRCAVLCFEEADALPGSDAFSDQARLMEREEACKLRHKRTPWGRRAG